VESIEFTRMCDDAFGNIDAGVGNIYQDITVRDGCDKCSQSFGDTARTALEPVLRDHYNATFRRIDFVGCNQPFRMTNGGRFLIEQCSFLEGASPDFPCTGPRFTSPESDDLVIHLFDSIADGCRRGLRFGGDVEALVRGNTVEGSMLRGILVSGTAKARLWENRVIANGGEASQEIGLGGVSVVDAASVDLGGGMVVIDGDASSSPGDNILCVNVRFGGQPQDVLNLTDEIVSAENNYWCNTVPEERISGAVTVDPFRVVAP
jgi:hypothetical protein